MANLISSTLAVSTLLVIAAPFPALTLPETCFNLTSTRVHGARNEVQILKRLLHRMNLVEFFLVRAEKNV